MILRFYTGCTDCAAGIHAANMHPRSIDEATTHILKYQFNNAAVYGPREDDHKSEATIRAVQSRDAYNGGRPPAHEDYRRQYAPSQRPRAYSPEWALQRSHASSPEWAGRGGHSPGRERTPPWESQERRYSMSPAMRESSHLSTRSRRRGS
ncbi:hypothetical protein PoB_005686700 [Plakobranchus ocellatus]|uniref:Uncharacterized protein n=1 Tax=Plakobranchus ocellatus TaxID=259542 RepID=A0AAV4CGE5_9GAST|nr:hypothetical protein PoB_005686700 [Plakobranchus ocellatus]